MSTPTAEAIVGMLPVYIPKTDPEEAARRREVRDGGRCTMCGAEWPLEVHHVLPRHLGGADSPRNLRTLCRRCHDMAHRSGAAERAMADEHQARLEAWG